MPFISRLHRAVLTVAFFFLTFMTVLRAVTWFLFRPAGEHASSAIQSFLLGFRYDARIVAIPALLLLLTGSIRPLDPFQTKAGKRIWLLITGCFTIFLLFFYCFDFFHYRYLSQRLNASALAFLEDASISGAMVWQTYPVVRILLGIVVLILLFNKVMKVIHSRIANSLINPGKRKSTPGFLIIFLLCAVAIFGRIGQYPLRWSDAFNLGSDFRANLALNPVQSFFSSLSFRTTTFDRQAVEKYYPVMAEYLGVEPSNRTNLNFRRSVSPDPTGIDTKPNVVIVICESFSAYKSSMWGNPLNTTPFFNSMAEKGLFFDNCFTPHYGTARGVWATITGIPDVDKVKTASRNPAMVDQHSILNDFQGYEKYYFLGGSTSWANIRGLLTNNIDSLHLYEEGSYDVPDVDVWGISDKNLFLQADKVLAKEKRPFVAVIQTADNHRPYTISKEDEMEFVKRTVSADSLKRFGFQSNEEFNAFRYTDFGYRKFIEAAERSPYFANTVFVFIGDHGIQGDAGEMFPRAWTDNSLSSYHVPLLFYAPALIKPQRRHDVASQVDLLPTAAGLANIAYTNTTLGRDLSKTDTIGNSSVAFILNHSNFENGIVRKPFSGSETGQYYYVRQATGKQEKLLWADFMQKPPAAELHASQIERFRELTSAFYETARYMLLNNKKQK